MSKISFISLLAILISIGSVNQVQARGGGGRMGGGHGEMRGGMDRGEFDHRGGLDQGRGLYDGGVGVAAVGVAGEYPILPYGEDYEEEY